jgi:hypothetical protein
MQKHKGYIRFREETGVLRLQVKVNGLVNPQQPWVKDLKQLSGASAGQC